MYPNQNNSQQDLLAKLLANKKMLFVVIGVVIVLLTAVPLILSSSADKTPGRVAAIHSHIGALAELARDQGRELNSASLRDQNANVSILLTGAVNDIGAVVPAAEVDAQSAARHAARYAVLQTALEESIQTNTLDMTYQAQMSTELEVVEAQLAGISNSTRSASTKEVMTSVAERIKQGREAFEGVSL